MEFFTIGYGGRKPEDFIDLLKAKGIATLVDVRLRPDRASMGVYVKAKEAVKGLEALLNRNGIAYVSLIELGNLFLEFDDWQQRYTQLLEKSGNLVLERLLSIETRPICLMCAEKKAEECHRRQIADYLVAQKGWMVEHIE